MKTAKVIAVDDSASIFTSKLSPFLKWPGGKSSELEKIAKASPTVSDGRFIEPFVGGGSVLLAVDSSIPALANDICPELIDLYNGGSANSQSLKTKLEAISAFWEALTSFAQQWEQIATQLMTEKVTPAKVCEEISDLLSKFIAEFGDDIIQEFYKRLNKDLPSKLVRMQKLQVTKNRILPLDEFTNNLEGSIRAAFYMAVRKRYNVSRLANIFNDTRTADFLFLREFSYASMFRFNSKGEFNIPYGGISYNRKNFSAKILRLYAPEMRERLSNTRFFNADFEFFLDQIKPTKNDFLFVDPPYDSDFTDYDGKEFRNLDQTRLADCLNKASAKIMIVIGDTELIRSLYKAPKWNIQEDKMLYKWTIKSRNEREKTHLTITNY
jgi:DNA adenine methylase